MFPPAKNMIIPGADRQLHKTKLALWCEYIACVAPPYFPSSLSPTPFDACYAGYVLYNKGLN